MLQSQIPFMVVERLFKINVGNQLPSSSTLAYLAHRFVNSLMSIEESFLRKHSDKITTPKHFFDLLYKSLSDDLPPPNTNGYGASRISWPYYQLHNLRMQE
ncbi:hypothetical protein Syun_029487 [Stephania yunnanensis]|uniref:Uncharacterized protein n=1 Tax=Stephania yunnanensis TaxID=152371 RepID=A0AAP0E8P5_9MAGN